MRHELTSPRTFKRRLARIGSCDKEESYGGEHCTREAYIVGIGVLFVKVNEEATST
jgi:hypothetical protein